MSVDASPLAVDLRLVDNDVVRAPELTVVRVDTQSRYQRIVKPVFDVLAAAILLILLMPVFLAVALAVRVSLGEGVLFRQDRVGMKGRVFTVCKFRTMLPDRRGADSPCAGVVERRQAHKRDDDPRHTVVGRILRKWSLDELPQLLNVLKGEMSIVGPRPELVSVVEGYEPWQHTRHNVRPGLTGLWQINCRGYRRPMKEDTYWDIEYVRTVSLRADISILVRTIPVLVFRANGS